jgi:ribonucleoside-diphosphate reductase alpha chain
VKYLRPHDGTAFLGQFHFAMLADDVRRAVRAMDMVVDLATYPLEEQRLQAWKTRRMGLGVTGLANALEWMGHPYGSDSFLEAMGIILAHVRDHAYRESIQLAREFGSFPLMDPREHGRHGFAAYLPHDIQKGIQEHGIRNSHLLSIAPCGTISLCADNVSSGIEPVFDYSVKRRLSGPSQAEEYVLEDYGVKFLGVKGKRAADVTAEEHLKVLAMAQRYVDSSVSKTCNVPSTMKWEDFEQLYVRAWQSGCKGITTFQEGGSRKGILSPVKSSCSVDPATGRRDCE